MQILITGQSGTLAPHFRRHLENEGHQILGWDRSAINPDEAGACKTWLSEHSPDAIIHLALGSEHWAERLAAWCAKNVRPFVFTSTAMVFDAAFGGPHKPSDERTARDEYGRYKIRCENLIKAANEDALIVRIGWQIDFGRQGNNMARQLSEEHDRQGHVNASRLWKPASSLMSDTAAATWSLVSAGETGLYHLDSNAADALTFEALAGLLGNALGESWCVRPNEDYEHDQRLIDDRVTMPSLRARLQRANSLDSL